MQEITAFEVVFREKTGHYEKALEMHSKCLKIEQAALGENHLHVADTYNNMGNVYSSQGQCDKALEMYNKCLKISLAVLGEDHPDVAATYNNMGSVYNSQGQYDKALETQQVSEDLPDRARRGPPRGAHVQQHGQRVQLARAV